MLQLYVKWLFVRSFSTGDVEADSRAALLYRTPILRSFPWLKPIMSPMRFVFGMPSDPTLVVISTFLKAGTTWMQQIVHQIRTNGQEPDENFSLDTVIPYIMPFSSIDMTPQLLFEPKAFKTHNEFEEVMHFGGRHITVMRHPYAVIWSLYHFFTNVVNVRAEDVGLEFFYFECFKKKIEQKYDESVLSFWKQRNNPNVLILFFEDMRSDLQGAVQKVASFMEKDLTEEELSSVCKHSAYEYMSDDKRKHQFDGNNEMRFIRSYITPTNEEKLPIIGTVRKAGGSVSQGKDNITDAIKQDLDEMWREKIMPVTGCASYEELRKSFKAQ